jgi:TPR repeat protein
MSLQLVPPFERDGQVRFFVGLALVLVTGVIGIHQSNFVTPSDLCARGDDQACMVTSYTGYKGRTTGKRDPGSDWKIACRHGVAAACAFPDPIRACVLGLDSSCDEVARTVAKADKYKDPARALLVLELGCERGGYGSCAKLADHFLVGEDVTKNPQRWIEIFQRRCDAGSAQACFDLGEAFHKGAAQGTELGPPDEARSQAAWQRSCDLGKKGCGLVHRGAPKL